MSRHNLYEDGEEEEDEKELSTSDDDEFQEDLEALSQACKKTGIDLSNFQSTVVAESAGDVVSSSDSESDDDLELYRNILDVCKPISLKPLATLHPFTSDDDDAEDDLQTLRAIERRIAAYTASASGRIESDCGERFHNLEEPHRYSTDNLSSKNLMLSSSLTQSHQSCAGNISENSTFPKSAHMLFDAIKKNRSYQRFIRNKLTQIEAKIDGNKQLMERVKILKDLGTYSKKRTGRALNPRKDPRIRLISARKPRASVDLEDNENLSIKYYGPPENSQVANYKMALAQFPLSLHRKKWSKEERESLTKGIRQQFQEKVLQGSVDWFSATEESCRNGSNLDSIIASIKDLEFTPEMIREFLPKVNWNQLALMYVPGRSGAECETRWLNCEDPLINRRPWTAEEDKNLLFIIQEKGIGNWHGIAVCLGTNRTPFQCLVRYQRSLNACILNREWTEEEDDKLRSAVEELGERNWQTVAWALTGRTGSQCSNRWKKSLNPARQRVGRWNPDEDKRLEVAVTLFKPKNWKKIAEFVPGRTQVQCRERWVNSLDPSINRSRWTEGEDARLEAAIQEYGHCWSKVAACMDSRTDNQCWRRWKILHPDQLHLLQEARKIRKSVCISNFVDRESERPSLGPSDFVPLAIMGPMSKPPSKRKRKQRKKVLSSSEENHETISSDEVEASGGKDRSRKKRKKQDHENNNYTEPVLDESLPLSVLITRISRKGKHNSPTERKGCTKRALKRHTGRKEFSKLGKKQKSDGSKTCSLPETVDDSAVMHGGSSVSEDIEVVRQNVTSDKKTASETGARGTKPSPQSSVTICSVENLLLDKSTSNEGSKGPGQECESRNSRELFRNKLKIKRKPRAIENADTSEPNGDDMKLATFLQGTLKKKRRHQDSNSEQSLSPVQNDNAKTCYKNAVPECASERVVVVAEDDSPQDRIREPVSCSSQKSDLKVGDEIRVYCRRRLKKKQPSH